MDVYTKTTVRYTMMQCGSCKSDSRGVNSEALSVLDNVISGGVGVAEECVCGSSTPRQDLCSWCVYSTEINGCFMFGSGVVIRAFEPLI